MSDVQLTIHLANFSAEPSNWDDLRRVALNADRAGIDRLVVSDHVVFGEQLDAYGRPELGGVSGGVQPTGPDGHWLEPLIVLAMLSGITERVRLGTSILIAALRRPPVLAKELATLDVLSGGRVDLGVGVGWQREEYEASGLDFSRRGALLNECLEICQLLWTLPVVDHRSEHHELRRIHQMPKPLQVAGLEVGGLPVWIGGRLTRRNIDRIVRFGHGWIPWGDDIEALGPKIAALSSALEEAGRDPGRLRVEGRINVHCGAGGRVDVGATLEAMAALVDQGVTDLRLQQRWGHDHERDLDTMSALVEAGRERFPRHR